MSKVIFCKLPTLGEIFNLVTSSFKKIKASILESIKLNTYMIYTMNYKHKRAAKTFFENYEALVAENLEARIKRLSDESEV